MSYIRLKLFPLAITAQHRGKTLFKPIRRNKNAPGSASREFNADQSVMEWCSHSYLCAHTSEFTNILTLTHTQGLKLTSCYCTPANSGRIKHIYCPIKYLLCKCNCILHIVYFCKNIFESIFPIFVALYIGCIIKVVLNALIMPHNAPYSVLYDLMNNCK